MKLHQVQLLARVPIILKDLYDADLLEEDVIFAWAEKVGVDGPRRGGKIKDEMLKIDIILARKSRKT